jgi:LemA protein
MIGQIIVIVIVLAVVFSAVGIYNNLVSLRNQYRNNFSQIDVQLQRRYDLIPNLVETAKGYISHERETLEAVTAARGAAVSANQTAAANPGNPAAMQALSSAENSLSGSLGKLMVVVEAYPDLKANQNMMQLSEELTSTENKVAFARQAYNDSIMSYNTAREVFPGSVVAEMFAFTKAEPFHVDNEAVREAPKVSFQ